MSFPESELRRLDRGPEPGEEVPGIGLVDIEATGDAAAVLLGRCRRALAIVAAGIADGWDAERWTEELPSWLTERFVPEGAHVGRSSVELAGDGPEERLAALDREPWTMLGWLWWFEADQRYWWWWDAQVAEPGRLRLQLAMADLPFPWDALRFLLKAAGADEISDVI